MRCGQPVHARSISTGAVAHLLRNLGDVHSIVENDVVRRVWQSHEGAVGHDEVARRVRLAVEAAIVRLEAREGDSAKRVGSIIKRCDIGGEPHDRAMRDMAISRPEFYRQLRAGRQAVAQAIAMTSPDLTSEADIPRDVVDMRLQAAYALALSGNVDGAVRHLAPLLDSLSGLCRVRIACVLAELRFDARLQLEAFAYLDVAGKAALLLRGNESVVAAALIAQVQAVIAFKNGVAYSEHVLDTHIERLRAVPMDALVADALATLLILKAARAMFAGRIAQAWRLLRTSPAAEARSRVLPRTRADHLTLSITLQVRLPGALDDAAADCAELYRFAVRSGMHTFATAALSERSRIATLRREPADAAVYASEALASSATFMTAWEHAAVCSVGALVALVSERPYVALELSREARRSCAPTAYPALIAALYEAEALRMVERFDESYGICVGMRDVLDRGTTPQLAAFAQLVAGKALVALGQGRKGRLALGDSESLLNECEYQGDYLATLRARSECHA